MAIAWACLALQSLELASGMTACWFSIVSCLQKVHSSTWGMSHGIACLYHQSMTEAAAVALRCCFHMHQRAAVPCQVSVASCTAMNFADRVRECQQIPSGKWGMSRARMPCKSRSDMASSISSASKLDLANLMWTEIKSGAANKDDFVRWYACSSRWPRSARC